MKLPSKVVCCLLGLAVIFGFSAPPARAFSLLGPFEPWMNTTNGFDPATDIGGPMAIDCGYRWNVPVVTYGFDESFLAYFGSNGVAAVESAINILNSLPPASQMDPSNFDDFVTRFNYEAASEILADLKSETLFLLLEHLGLASPSHYVFTLKDFAITNGAVEGNVLLRNFDPITEVPSAYVNDILLNYSLAYSSSGNGTNAQATVFPVNPGEYPNYLGVADGLQQVGSYFSGLSKDDIGGLRYLYSTNNVNFERLPPDVQSADANPLVNGALRGGVDKVTFVYQEIDQVLGTALSPLTIQFTNTYITNNMALQQTLKRVINRPDFLFSAGVLANASAWFERTGTTNWINNGGPSFAGPGVIQSPVKITFNKLGHVWQSSGTPPDDSAFENLLNLWGTFDGTTNSPFIYPTTGDAAGPVTVQLTLMTKPLPVNIQWTITDTNFTYQLQTSTNLTTWLPLFRVPLDGKNSTYINWIPASIQRFYRLYPL